MTHERHLRAMGSDCHLVVVGRRRLLDLLAARLEQLESRWSRFRSDSDISAIAARAGMPVVVHPDTVLLVQRMLDARARTGGWYDPTMQTELCALGYDRDLQQLPPATRAAVVETRGARVAVPVTVEGSTVAVPAGHGLDPGSIGKGLAADILVALAVSHGATGVLVNLGGDVRAAGLDPEGAPWGVVVADDAVDGAPTSVAWDRDGGVLLGLFDGALVTSTVRRRRWSVPGGTAHHLLDPRTGGPTTHDLETVTVLADEGWWADAVATAVVAAGPAGPGLAIELGLTARLTWADGSRLGLGAWGDRVAAHGV